MINFFKNWIKYKKYFYFLILTLFIFLTYYTIYVINFWDSNKVILEVPLLEPYLYVISKVLYTSTNNARIILITSLMVVIITITFNVSLIVFFILAGFIIKKLWGLINRYYNDNLFIDNVFLSIHKNWILEEKENFIKEYFYNVSYNTSKYSNCNVNLGTIYSDLLDLNTKKEVISFINDYYQNTLIPIIDQDTKINIILQTKETFLFLNSHITFKPNSLNYSDLLLELEGQNDVEVIRKVAFDYFTANFKQPGYLDYVLTFAYDNSYYIIAILTLGSIYYFITSSSLREQVADGFGLVKDSIDQHSSITKSLGKVQEKSTDSLDNISKIQTKIINNIQDNHKDIVDIQNNLMSAEASSAKIFQDILEVLTLNDKFELLLGLGGDLEVMAKTLENNAIIQEKDHNSLKKLRIHVERIAVSLNTCVRKLKSSSLNSNSNSNSNNIEQINDNEIDDNF